MADGVSASGLRFSSLSIGTRSYAQSGIIVHGGGDINGDGFADLVVGVPGLATDQTGFYGYYYSSQGYAPGYSGGAYVLFGGSDGTALSRQTLLTPQGYSDLRGMGAAVATADVNGDGFDDLIVASADQGTGNQLAYNPDYGYYYDYYQSGYVSNGEPLFVVQPRDASDAGGRVTIVFGEASAATNSTLQADEEINGLEVDPAAFEMDLTPAPLSLSSAGDVNGDGFEDFLIGAPEEDTPFIYSGFGPATDRGAVTLVFGGGDGVGGANTRINVGALSSSPYGREITESPDFDGTPQTTDHRFGQSVASAGDINGDGLDDLIIGAPGALNETGRAAILFGAFNFTGPSRVPLPLAAEDAGRITELRDGAATGLGQTVVGLGDVSGDGIDDVLVSDSAGTAHILFGSLGGFGTSLNLANLPDANVFTLTGLFGVVSGAGDFNGDGIGDIAFADSTAVTILFGGAHLRSLGGLAADQVVAQGVGAEVRMAEVRSADGRFFGGYGVASISAAGDIDGDGFDDVVVGVYGLPGYYGDPTLSEGVVIFGTGTGPATPDDGEIFIDGAGALAHGVVEGGEGEANELRITVTRTGPTDATATVDYAVTGLGANPADAADFAGGVLPSGTVTFAVGQAEAEIILTTAGDREIELDEAFSVTLSNVQTSGPALTLTGTTTAGVIETDDRPILVEVNALNGYEGDTSLGRIGARIERFNGFDQEMTFQVTIGNHPDSIFALDDADIDGTFPAVRTVTLGVGEAVATVEIPLIDDDLAEGLEVFSLDVELLGDTPPVVSYTRKDTGTRVEDDDAANEFDNFFWSALPEGASFDDDRPERVLVPEGTGDVTNLVFEGNLFGIATAEIEYVINPLGNGAGVDGAQEGDFGNVIFGQTQSVFLDNEEFLIPIQILGDGDAEADEGISLRILSITDDVGTQYFLDKAYREIVLTNDDDANTDPVVGIGDDTDDLLQGGLGDDTLDGGAGDDTLIGFAGADTLIGGADNDTLRGGPGQDIYVFGPGFGTDVLEDGTGADGGALRFLDGITVDDLSFFQPAADPTDLLIRVGADSLRIDSFFTTGTTLAGVIDRVEFADGTQFSLLEFGTAGQGETVTPANLPPEARDDVRDFVLGAITPFNILSNDQDRNADDLTITALQNAAFIADQDVTLDSGSTISVSETGQVTYTPDQDLLDGLTLGDSFTEDFTYQIGDGRGGFDSATVTMTVAAPDPVELDLVLEDGLVSGQEGTAQVTVTVNADLATPAEASLFPSAEPAFSAASYLMSVSSQVGMVRDAFTKGFQTQDFILARDLEVGVPKQFDLAVKGVGGPNSTIGLSAQLLAPQALLDVQSIFTDITPDFTATSALSRIGANFSSAMGATIEAFTNALLSPADRLGSFGLNDTSASAALSLALDVAADFGSIAERSIEGSFGKGWSSIADLGLDFDGSSVQLRGLTDLSALRALSIDAAALYTVSASVGRAVSLAGNSLALSTPARPTFEAGVGGQFASSTGFDGTLSREGSGYRLSTSAGEALNFDGNGAFLSMERSDGLMITASHDADMRITGLSGPNGDALTFARASTGRVESVTDADSRTASFTYDASGQLEAVTRAEGQSSFAYTDTGDLSAATAPGGIVSSFAYDGSGRLATANYGSGAQTEAFAYDDAGRLTITDGAGRSSQIDLLMGGVTGRVTNGEGGASELIYDDAGQLIGMRAADGSETALVFDDAGRLLQVTDANGATLTYTYGAQGDQPTSFTDAGGATRIFTYDDAGRLVAAEWDDGTTLTFAYDGQGNLTGTTNRRGEEITTTYDARGRILSESDGSAGAASYAYDAQGNLTSITDARGTTAMAYDGAGRVIQIDMPDGNSLFYTYTAAGQRASISDGGDYTVFYDYDGAGRLAALRDEDSTLVAYTYDAAGNLVREDNGNGTATTIAYDSAGRITWIENLDPDGAVQSFNAYSYDVAGQRIGHETQDGAWTLGYDGIGQLISAQFASTNGQIADKSLTYEYDDAGNRTRVVEDGVETLYTANALNQYTAVGDATFTYDADGNMLTRTDPGGTTTYTYDISNRLTSVTEADGTVLTFTYDAFGNRVGKIVDGVETTYLVDPFGLGDVVSEFTDGALTATYAHGLGLAQAEIGGQAAWYDADAVGTVTTLTGADGSIANSYAFTPFGTEMLEVETLANDFEFNGVLGVAEDADDLTFMRARSYSDELGRFLSEDPLWQDGDAGNLYRFAANAPLEFTDPAGEYIHLGWFVFRVAVTALGAVGTSQAVVSVGQSQLEAVDAAQKGDFQRADEKQAEAVGKVAGVIAGEVGPLAVGKVLKTGKAVGELVGSTKDAQKSLEGPVNGAVYRILEDVAKGQQSPEQSGSTQRTLDQSPLSGDTNSPEANPPILPAPRAGTGGDPHIQTFDGLGYSFQAVGEFIMFAGADGSFQFQVRQAPLANSNLVSVNSAVATEIVGVRVALYADRDTPLLINGVPTVLEADQVIALGGGSIHFDGRVYVITNEFGDGVAASVTRGLTDFLTIQNFLAPDRGGQVVGLFGNGDGVAGNDLQLPDGTVLSTAPIAATDLYGVFADGWRVTDETSLFDYEEGESTETFTDRSFPPQIVTLDDLDPEARAAAELAAINAGLVPGTFEFETTVLDVALSGDTSFADATQVIPNFDPHFDPLTDFALVIQTVVNEAPTAAPDTAETAEDTPITVDVLANDTDPEDDALTILGAADLNGGGVQVVNGELLFTPAADFNGQTVISYQLGDAGGNSVTGSLTVTVTSVPDDPRAQDDSGTGFLTDEDTPLILPDLLANDSEPDGEALSIISIDTSGLLGTLIQASSGSFTYDPGDAFQSLTGGTVTDSFTYRITDGTGRFDEATVTVRVAGINDAPTLTASRSVVEVFGPPPSDPIVSLAGRDVDTPGSLSFALSGPDAGAFQLSTPTLADGGRDVALSLALRPDGTLPRDANRNGSYEVAVTVSDGQTLATQAIAVRFPETGALIGTTLDDTLDGLAETTQIFARDGDDLITTGGGVTEVFGGDGVDTLSYAGLGSGVDANLARGVIKGTGFRDSVAEVEILIGTAQRDVLVAGADTQRIEAGDGDNVIRMGADTDGTLISGGGADRVFGADGAEVIDTGAGADLVRSGRGDDDVTLGLGDDIARTGDGADLVRGGQGADRLFGNGQNDMLLGGDDDDFLNGGRGADLLEGGAGDDALRGGTGVDTLIGGLGDDNLYGGLSPLGDGNVDTFVFRELDTGTDRIKDFETGRDRIDLTDFGFVSFTEVEALASDAGATNLRLQLSDDVVVIVENYRLDDLDVGDFLFGFD